MPIALTAPGLDAQANTLARGQKRYQPRLEVPNERAVCLKSDIPFAELSIANPVIAIFRRSRIARFMSGQIPRTYNA